MSTSSGKPPLDEPLEPPTQRQPLESSGAPATEGEPIYGAGVPYGGDDQTEEIDPIALELPFSPEERSAPAAARAPSAPGGREPGAPIAQVALSDLFDSVPSSSLAPPDPAAFASSRPSPLSSPVPPASAEPVPEAAAARAAPSSSAAVVPLPSIDVGGTPSRAPARPAPHPAEDPHPPEEAEPPARRSVPTLESIPDAASPAARARSEELGSSPAASRPPVPLPSAAPTVAFRPGSLGPPPPSDPEPAAPEPSAPEPSDPEPAAPEPSDPEPAGALGPDSDELHGHDIPRFASDIPTSRPPDVVTPAQPEPRGAMATVAAPVTSHGGKVEGPLPSIMLAKDVEAEPDGNARRALRAARATVRLELPKSFMRPGSPVRPGAAPALASPYQGPAPVAPASASWLEGPRARRWLGALFVALLGALVLALALRARTGSLVVTALGPGSRAVDDVTIFVDDQPLCDVSPCRIKGLPPGTHTLRATAPNLASRSDHTVEIESGSEATYNIELLSGGSELRSGGFRIAAGERPLTLYVDGKRVGKLPQEVLGLSSGKHWLKLDPEDGSPAIEKPVEVIAGETIEVDARAPKRSKALVTIELDADSEGAAVTLDDAFLLDFPAELELEQGSVHTLSASKPGYEDLSMEVEIAPGETEKRVEVSLEPAEPAPRKARPKAARRPAPKPASTTANTQLADPTQGLLNISSVPPSQIILNGRPLGSTPKTGIAVPGDSLQTIVFVHPKMGRRRAQKFVPAGKERTVAIRF